MSYTEQDRTLALAGVFQAAHMVQMVANRGLAESSSMEASIFSLFQTQPDTVMAVFDGGATGVGTGLRQILALIEGQKIRDTEQLRYVLDLMKLERKLTARPAMLAQVADGIEEARPLLKTHPLLHATVLSHLAELYTQTISELHPRILVRGEPAYLEMPQNVNRIRSLLLAGIRAAMLWRQVGGRQWRTFLFPGRVRTAAYALLEG
ncbi:MAG: high frequency lysogenization protein HflD [Pseudomonadota bacterium]